jgi:hypothetical protein
VKDDPPTLKALPVIVTVDVIVGIDTGPMNVAEEVAVKVTGVSVTVRRALSCVMSAFVPELALTFVRLVIEAARLVVEAAIEVLFVTKFETLVSSALKFAFQLVFQSGQSTTGSS